MSFSIIGNAHLLLAKHLSNQAHRCPFPVYAWSIIGPAVSERFTVSKLSEKRFPTSAQPSVNIKRTIDPDLGKVGTGQLQFEYTVDNKATSRTFWDLSMIDGCIVQQPPPTVRPSLIPNKPGNIFHGHHVTVTPRGNVEAGNPLSKCRQLSTPDNKGFNYKPDNVYWMPYDDQTSMHVCSTWVPLFFNHLPKNEGRVC